MTSNSTYMEAKHVEIYLPGGKLCLVLPVWGKLRRILSIWRPDTSKSTYLEVDNALFYLFEANYVEFYLFGGQTRRNLPTWR